MAHVLELDYFVDFFFQVLNIADFNPKRIPQSGNIAISIFGSNFDISDPTLAAISVAETPCTVNNLQ